MQYLSIPNLTSYHICHRDYLVYYKEPTVLPLYVCCLFFLCSSPYLNTIIYYFNLSYFGLFNFISKCCLHGHSETITCKPMQTYFLRRSDVL
jgi:hypothetical protein